MLVGIRATHKPLTVALLGVFFTTIVWTLYVVLMSVAPAPFADENLRALVRVGVVLLPAVVISKTQRNVSAWDYFRLRKRWLRGTIIGFITSAAYLALVALFQMQNPSFELPSGLAIWFNFIVGSPLAEELLYRGMLYAELERVMKPIWAMLISALMFAILHLPVWIIMDQLDIAAIIGNFFQIFAYGLAFAALLRFTRSLWAPLAAHWLNNFVLLSIVSR